MKSSFILYGEWERHFALLTPPQQGALIMALFAYNNRDDLPSGDPAVSMAFSFIKAAIDENDAKWEREKAAKAEAGRAGGLAKASKASSAKQSQKNSSKPSLYVSVSGSVSDSVSAPPSEIMEKRAGKPRFTPPTFAEVQAYVSERHSLVDPQGFIDFYASKGWVVGKTPMKDWKAACRNAEKWERWGNSSSSPPVPKSKEGNPFLRRAKEMQGDE